MTTAARALLAATALAWAPRATRACAVCLGGTEEASRFAFVWTTALLSALPLLMVGGIVWWLWRRARRLERDREHREIGMAAIGR